jgi:HprK-related kinase A
VRSDLDQVRQHFGRLYSDFPIQKRAGGHFDLIIAGGRGVRRFVRPKATIAANGAKPFLSLPAAISGAAFEWALNWCIARHAHQRVAVHGAVVERDGRALILSGPSGSGKSTLCAALALQGWRLFSDEFALMDPNTHDLLPLPRPVSLREAAVDIIAKRGLSLVFGPEGRDVEGARFAHLKPPPDSVRRASEPAPPRVIVLPRYMAGATTSLEPLSKARALIHLTDQSFNYNYLGPRGYECAVEVVRQCDCYALDYGDLDDALAVLSKVTRR